MSGAADNEAVVRNFLGAWERRDSDLILSLCTDDAIWEYVSLPPMEGKEALAKHLSEYAGRPAPRIEVRNLAASDSAAFAERIDHAMINGRRTAVRICGVFEFRDGKISAWREYFDARAFNA